MPPASPRSVNCDSRTGYVGVQRPAFLWLLSRACTALELAPETPAVAGTEHLRDDGSSIRTKQALHCCKWKNHCS